MTDVEIMHYRLDGQVGSNVIVEFNGITHYDQNYQLTLKDQMKYKIINTLNREVLPIGFVQK